MTLENVLIPVLAIMACGIVVGLILTICARVFEVKTDESTQKIRDALPGINCGVCGFSGCDDYAKNIVENGAETNKCVPGGDKTSKEISEILGVEYEDVIEKVAFVKCGGTCDNVASTFKYDGEPTCAAANLFYKGEKACKFSCLGFGDCATICEYDAINISNGVASVDDTKCIGCGLCAKTCPKSVISIKNLTQKVNVACNNTLNGKLTRLACKVGCIGCKICVKNCPSDAITVENNLAFIDGAKCTECGKCIEVCPQKSIH